MTLYDVAMEILVDELNPRTIEEEEIEHTISNWLTDLLMGETTGTVHAYDIVDAYLSRFEEVISTLEEMGIDVEYDCYFSDWWNWLEEMSRESF